MVLSPKVIVKEGGIHGYCWFAGEDIKAGEMIWAARSPPGSAAEAPYLNYYQSWDQIQLMPEKTRVAFLDLAYQVSDTQWLGIDPSAAAGPHLVALQQELYINHSCDGNVWHQSDSLIVARRDIAMGEEICYDYALTESDETWILAERCLCGARDCRVRVCGTDWQLPSLQSKYGRHFLTYILAKIDALAAKTAAAQATSESGEKEHKARSDEDKHAAAAPTSPASPTSSAATTEPYAKSSADVDASRSEPSSPAAVASAVSAAATAAPTASAPLIAVA